MPELAEVETQKTAGFVDRGYNHENVNVAEWKLKKRRSVNLKLNNVEKKTKNSNQKKKLPKEKEADTEAKEETLSAEEKSFKKRYGDLRRHMQDKEKEWDEKFKAFEETIKKESIIPPKSDEDIEQWAKEYPDVAGIVETIAAKKAQGDV
jgi:FMN phosphatase YigB (HAD superfamily)